MKVCFLPCWLDGNSSKSASVRVRCEWVAKYWDEAEVYQEGMDLDSFDVLVYQKVFLTQRARGFARTYKHKIQIFDLNDPLWMDANDRLERHLVYMDAATCITKPVADWLGKRVPTRVIPDRLDLDLHVPRVCKGDTRQLCWAGYAQSYALVEEVFGNFLEETGLSLTVISNKRCGKWPYIPWESPEQECEQVKRFDIVLDAKSDEGLWKYKSMHKTHKAWALGLPVAHNVSELRTLLAMRPQDMRGHCDSLRREIEVNWDVKKSVKEWREWIDEIANLHSRNW